MKINAKKLIKSAKYKICFSLTSQVEIANAKIGNLNQPTPLPKDVVISEENKAEIIEVAQKSRAHFTQLILNQDHESLVVDFIKKESAIKVINVSVSDLLNIINKGIKIHEIIKIL